MRRLAELTIGGCVPCATYRPTLQNSTSTDSRLSNVIFRPAQQVLCVSVRCAQIKTTITFHILGYHSGALQDSVRLGYDAVSLVSQGKRRQPQTQ